MEDFPARGYRRLALTADGQVQTVAGAGEMGYAEGDGKDARFAEPTGLGVDAEGALYRPLRQDSGAGWWGLRERLELWQSS